jgi:hypothetical protein
MYQITGQSGKSDVTSKRDVTSESDVSSEVDGWRVGHGLDFVAVQIGGPQQPIKRLSASQAIALGRALIAEGHECSQRGRSTGEHV